MIYKVLDDMGIWHFVEPVEPPPGTELRDPDVWEYVSTRTPWPTSLIGQIESEGWIEKSRLVTPNRKDKKALEAIERTQERAKRMSLIMYQTQRAREYMT